MSAQDWKGVVGCVGYYADALRVTDAEMVETHRRCQLDEALQAAAALATNVVCVADCVTRGDWNNAKALRHAAVDAAALLLTKEQP